MDDSTIRPSRLNGLQIDAEAQRIAENYGFKARESDVRDLARTIAAGKNCIETLDSGHTGDLDSGSLEVFGPGDFKIYLSPISSPVRDSFTIAHELGHYFLHCGHPPGTVKLKVGRSGEPNLVERQANRFAAALLMPPAQFTDCFKKADGDILMLSGLFKVSQQAARVRAKSLHLVD